MIKIVDPDLNPALSVSIIHTSNERLKSMGAGGGH